MCNLILNSKFGLLKLLNKYLAYFLLIVFSWAVLPSHTLHGLFANHEDTDCDSHVHSGTAIEKKHTHCEILKTNTPVYDNPELVISEKIEAIVVSEINTHYTSCYYNQNFLSVPARGPPTA